MTQHLPVLTWDLQDNDSVPPHRIIFNMCFKSGITDLFLFHSSLSTALFLCFQRPDEVIKGFLVSKWDRIITYSFSHTPFWGLIKLHWPTCKPLESDEIWIKSAFFPPLKIEGVVNSFEVEKSSAGKGPPVCNVFQWWPKVQQNKYCLCSQRLIKHIPLWHVYFESQSNPLGALNAQLCARCVLIHRWK